MEGFCRAGHNYYCCAIKLCRIHLCVECIHILAHTHTRTHTHTHTHTLGMGDIEILVYDYCEARISRLSRLLFPLYFY